MNAKTELTSTKWELHEELMEITGLFAGKRVTVLSVGRERDELGDVWRPVLRFGAPADLALLLQAPDLQRRLRAAEEDLDELWKRIRIVRETLTDE